jgi:hypothetical protein
MIKRYLNSSKRKNLILLENGLNHYVLMILKNIVNRYIEDIHLILVSSCVNILDEEYKILSFK